eukprot:1003228-Lingulodinium_polyedra.AAC.1
MEHRRLEIEKNERKAMEGLQQQQLQNGAKQFGGAATRVDKLESRIVVLKVADHERNVRAQ